MFEIILFSAVCVCLVVILVCRFGFPHLSKQNPEPWFLDYARSFFPVLLIVFMLRGFVAEPFQIPSGSMLPTLEIKDFILVNKFKYGLRLPIVHKKVVEIDEPERGDVVVFRFPPNPKINYIKRLIGLPGDRIEYQNDTLYVNGEKIAVVEQDDYLEEGELDSQYRYEQTLKSTNQANSEEVAFSIILNKNQRRNFRKQSWTVPKGHYFMMGDNRDNSADSRSGDFTFVPDENIVGEAFFIWMSWGTEEKRFNGYFDLDYQRIGNNIKARVVEPVSN